MSDRSHGKNSEESAQIINVLRALLQLGISPFIISFISVIKNNFINIILEEKKKKLVEWNRMEC